MHTVIIANSPFFDALPFVGLLQAADMVIGADGGGNALHALGLTPHMAIGDFDSLQPEALAAFAAAGTDVRRYPPAKDETDLELALLAAVEKGATQIDLLGAFGGRWDQTLANIALLAMPELAGRHVRLLDVGQEAYLVRDAATIEGNVGDTISLLPLGGPAHGITTVGLEYSLHNATLYFERSRGVSNVLVQAPGHVKLTSGLLLVVRVWQ
ncbi:MAG: thiamine diphosphokinase [Chloroflexaceae bacterium]|jgi:thiamine pyrophosphokinase|nr:thiamine diphosphokinase [Chloroflexaceae bacterium]